MRKESCLRGVLLVTALLVLAPTAFTWTSPLNGTWSGHWVPGSGYTSVTVRFTLDGDTWSGELINPERVAFDEITFDGDTLELVAVAESSEAGQFRLEARIEEETRLNGTLFHDDVSGDLRLTKWTFRPT